MEETTPEPIPREVYELKGRPPAVHEQRTISVNPIEARRFLGALDCPRPGTIARLRHERFAIIVSAVDDGLGVLARIEGVDDPRSV